MRQDSVGTRVRPLVVLGGAIPAAAACFTAVTGGVRADVAGIAISSRDWRRPAALAVMLLIGRAAYLWRRHPHGVRQLTLEVAASALCAIPLLMSALGLFYLDKACGGLDSSGYVSTAVLLTAGRLSVPQPLLDWLPITSAIDALTPLGYVPSRDGLAIVPRFPLGLPMVMALFRAVIGVEGPFYVAPVLGAATVALSYAIVRRQGGALAGGVAAVLVSTHPVVVAYSLQPMSDVPAAFWLVLATFLLTRTPARPVAAGAAAGMAMLTRPPLALAALVLAFIALEKGRPVAIRFVAAFVPFAIGLALLHSMLYGAPTASGYGNSADLFALAAVPQNVRVYGRWLLSVHTPLLLVLVAAAWIGAGRRFALIASAMFAAVAIPYLFYVPSYDDWETLRFLLPGLVFLLMAAALASVHLLEAWMPPPAAALTAALLSAVVCVSWYQYVDNRQVFSVWLAESRYARVGEWVTSNTAPDAVVLSSLHSGSIRYYSGRTTIRWDRVPPNQFAPMVAAIFERRRQILLVLDGNAEREEFEQRFAPRDLGGVRIEPLDGFQNVILEDVKPNTEP